MTDTRERIVQTIIAKPGIPAGSLAKLLDLAPSAVSYHVRALGKQRLVYFSWDCGEKRLFWRVWGDDDDETL